MNKTKIDWCDYTLNPVVGCAYGCPFCYARRMNNRFGWVKDFSKPQFFSERLKQLKSKKPKTIFMDSMSDIADWKPEWAFTVIQSTFLNPQHRYLFLTKRPSAYWKTPWTTESSNFWYGTTICRDEDMSERAGNLYGVTNRANTFLSIEPILEPITDKRVSRFGWVIIGAETGNRKGKVVPRLEWVQAIVDQCRVVGVPVFLKNSLRDIWGEPLIQEFPW